MITKKSTELDFKEFINFPIGGCSNELDRIYTTDEERNDLYNRYKSPYQGSPTNP